MSVDRAILNQLQLQWKFL